MATITFEQVENALEMLRQYYLQTDNRPMVGVPTRMRRADAVFLMETTDMTEQLTRVLNTVLDPNNG